MPGSKNKRGRIRNLSLLDRLANNLDDYRDRRGHLTVDAPQGALSRWRGPPALAACSRAPDVRCRPQQCYIDTTAGQATPRRIHAMSLRLLTPAIRQVSSKRFSNAEGEDVTLQ